MITAVQSSTRPLYFMVKPPPAVALHIAALSRGSRCPRAELLHITLLPFGDRLALPPRLLRRLLQIASDLEAAPFRVVFDRIVQGNGACALRGSEVMRGANAFQAKLASTLAKHGLSIKPRYRFVPHVTIDYRADDLSSEVIDPISWRVEEFQLVESVVGKGAHIEHGRWLLRA